MAGSEQKLWKQWADALRQEMMSGLTPEVTKSVEQIATETETTKATRTLHGTRFWSACQSGQAPNHMLVTAGFVIEYEPDEDKKVQEVTLRLNESWMTILQRVIDRKSSA